MEFRKMTEICESACIGKDVITQEVKSISPASQIIKNSTGRKSFSKRRSTCLDSLGVYFDVLIKLVFGVIPLAWSDERLSFVKRSAPTEETEAVAGFLAYSLNEVKRSKYVNI